MTDFSTARITRLPSYSISSASREYERLSNNSNLYGNDRQVYQDALLTTNLNLITERYSYLEQYPEALIEVAGAIDPITAATQGGIMNAKHSIFQNATAWNELPDAEQRSIWEQLGEQEQQAIIHAGGKPPQGDDGNWLGDILDFGAKATGFVLGGIGSAISAIPGGENALSVLTTIGNVPFALYRGIRQLDSWQQALALAGGVAAVAGGIVASPFTAGGSLSLSAAGLGTLSTIGAVGLTGVAGASLTATAVGGGQYLQAVSNSWNGERAFLPEAQKAAFDMLQQEDFFVIAKDLAYELDEYELVAIEKQLAEAKEEDVDITYQDILLQNVLTEFAGVANASQEQVLRASIARVAEIYAEPDSDEFRTVAENLYRLYEDERFRDAVKVLQDGKISMGRDAARILQLDPDSDLHRIVSGSIDAVTIFALDPLLAASPVAKFARFARYSPYGGYKALRSAAMGRPGSLIAGGDNLQWRVDLGQKNKKVRAMDEQIMEAVNTNDASLMPKNMRPIWTEIRDYWSQQGLLDSNYRPVGDTKLTTDHLYDWMRDSNVENHIAKGISTVPGLGFTVIKPISDKGPWGVLRKNLREFRDEVIDTNANILDDANLDRLEDISTKQMQELDLIVEPNNLDTPLLDGLVSIDLSEPIVRDTLGATLGRGTGNVLAILPFGAGQKLGTFIDAVSNMAPKRGYIALDGPDMVDDVTRFVNAFGMTLGVAPHIRDKWIKVITGQGDVAARGVLIRHFYDSVFTASGFKTSFRGEQIYKEFMQKFNQYYGIGGIDELGVQTANGVVPTRTGLMPHQSSADNIAIPDIREMIKAQRVDNYLAKKIGYQNPGRWIDAAQNKIWKPSVVLRIGFIPRAIGEEALAWVARGTTGQVLAENRGRKLAKMDIRDEIVERVSQGSTLDDIYTETVLKLESGIKFDDLTLAERQVLSGYRNPNNIKRLERIVNRRSDSTNIFNSVIINYENWLRRVLDPNRYVDGWQTSGRKRFVDFIDAQNPLYSILLLGKPHSWRRVGAGGLNQHLRTATRDWVITHSDAVMRATSAGNLSYREQIVNDPQAIMTVTDDGAMSVEYRLQDPHSRELYTPGTSNYENALHEAVHKILDDGIVAPIVLEHMPMLKPSAMTPELFDELGDLIDGWDQLPYQTRIELLDAYMNRPDRLSVYPTGHDLYDPATGFKAKSIPPKAQRAIDVLFDSNLDAGVRAWYASQLHKELVIQMEIMRGASGKNLERLRRLRFNKATYKTDFVDTVDELRTRLLNDLETAGLSPQHRETIEKSIRTVHSDGTYVADRVPSNRRRVFIPEVEDFTTIRNKIERELTATGFTDISQVDATQIAKNIAEELVAGVQSKAATPELAKFIEQNGVAVLTQSILALFENNFYKAPRGSLRNVGFSDARVAQWVGDLLSGQNMDAITLGRGIGSEVRTMRYLDIPTGQAVNVGDEWEGIRKFNQHSDGMEAFTLDEASAVQPQSIKGRTQEDSPLFGVSQQQALTNLMNDTIDHVFNTMGRNSRVVYTPVDYTKVLTTKGTKRVPIDPDAQFMPSTADQLWVIGDDGIIRKADLSDRRVFKPSNTPGGEPMWELVSPALMDNLDELTGSARVVRKNVITTDQVTGRVAPKTELVRATYSRVTDVPSVDVPQQVVGPKFKQVDAKTWDRILSFGFDRVVTPFIDSLLREPMSMHYFVQARLENSRFLSSMISTERLEGLLKQVDNIKDVTWHNGVTLESYRQPDTFKNIDVDNAVAIYDHVIDQLWPVARAENFDVITYLRTRDPLELDALSQSVFNTNTFSFNKETIDALEHLEQWWRHVNEISSVNAIRNIEPFLDTAESKSVFSQYTKNLLPFWYAEENFIKRWLRTAQTQGLFGLETVRKGQLGYMGLRHAGIIRTDKNGNDYVVIPGSGLLQDMISLIVPGMGDLPVGVLMQTSTNSLLPGFSAQAGSPSISPFATIPLSFMSEVFPEMQNWERAFAGDVGTDRTLYQKFVPPSLRRFVDAFTAGDDNAQFGSAMAQAMILMDARGEGLPDGYTKEELDEYLDKLREHARIVMFTRAVLGFVSPGAPSAFVTNEPGGTFSYLTGVGIESPQDLFSDAYSEYIRLFGYEEGVAKFLEEKPFATLWDIANPIALTVSQSETIAGASLPATEPALQWYDSNQTWADQNPYAAAWLVPNDEDTPFSRYAYSQQAIMGLRTRLTPQELMEELKYKEGSTKYFPRKKQYELDLNAAGTDERQIAAIDADWRQWKTMFFAANPIFEERMTSPDGKRRREQTLLELRRMLNDPLTPPSATVTAYGQIIRAYDRFSGALAQNKLNGNSASNLAARRNLIDGFELWTEGWLRRNPTLETFYEAIIKRELEVMIG